MYKKVSFILAIISAGISFSQSIVSLDSCIAWAKENYPQFKQKELSVRLAEQNEKGIRENWLPKLGFLAQATYNTEVVQFNFPGMDIKFPHDAYMTGLSLEQVIVDGGGTKAQGTIEKVNTEISLQQTEVELYKLVERINQLYINILLGRENVKILNLYKQDLENRAKNLKTGVDNGLVLPSALDELEAEILKTEQNIVESEYQLKGLYATLSIYAGREINESMTFSEAPLGGNVAQEEVSRPEMRLFDLQEEMLEARYKMTNVSAIPRVTVGANGNYGRPGPNFINQQMRFFASANITLHWNISSLYGLKREKTKLEINKSWIDLQKEAFLLNVKASLSSQTTQLEALNKVIEKDDEIIDKRQRVTASASSQMENGKITVVNYLSQLNAELQAKLNKKVHEIKKMNAISTINATSGAFKF
ncbi:MAG: TolC family protein [Flavobacteriia bacterium]|nr:TolC family protein [Flavobacteriia bacterium]OJX36817.1 MAG: hypothetical protein BGO87_13605 [Flavobacteriia bacterium 40-80]